jgi:hypothetical protein
MWAMITLMMEAVGTSETSVNFYETTRHKNPENSLLRDMGFIWFVVLYQRMNAL